ncbi:Neurotrimin [Eufriesea mexicana]|uniref:Neurotrimin n=1 Tax=Eufriesea mexicana TaxID=516756 RepID=A0A310SFI6_9HYME|nr:Neurotrimin [Eufriesea mexicana]
MGREMDEKEKEKVAVTKSKKQLGEGKKRWKNEGRNASWGMNTTRKSNGLNNNTECGIFNLKFGNGSAGCDGFREYFFPPMLWIPHQLVGAPLEHSVTLECNTEAHPTSLNYWTREDGVMIQGSNKYKITSTTEKLPYKTRMTLTIYDLQEEDYGSYKCVAKNPRGETDGVIHLYSKCCLFAHVLKYPVETFVELMTNRHSEYASGSPTRHSLLGSWRWEFLNRSLLSWTANSS